MEDFLNLLLQFSANKDHQFFKVFLKSPVSKEPAENRNVFEVGNSTLGIRVNVLEYSADYDRLTISDKHVCFCLAIKLVKGDHTCRSTGDC